MTIEIRTNVQRRDRWVNWLVVAVFVVALLAGWVVKTAAQGRTQPHEGQGFSLRYPSGWYRVTGIEAPILLQVEDRGQEPYRTTLLLQRRPLPAYERPLGLVRQEVAMERAMNPGDWSHYRVLNTEEPVRVCGHSAVRVEFAYVETNPDPIFVTPPLVMQGQDLLIVGQEDVYLFTLIAAEENYALAQDRLHDFVCSFEER